MFITMAHATAEVGSEVAAQPNMGDAFMTNMGLILVMFILFYVIMIRPQQKRMKEQRTMLDSLKKGDQVVTGGGLYGTVSNVVSDEQIEVDLGNIKVTAARYSLNKRAEDAEAMHKPANDTAAKVSEKAKKTPAKKTATKK